MSKNSLYYPKYKLDPISAQNQPYPSPSYYPYSEPKNTYCLNPMTLKSLKTLDIDDLQDVFGKGLQNQKHLPVFFRYRSFRSVHKERSIPEVSLQRA